MGINYNPILYLGRVFESEEDALAFYQKYSKLSEDQLKDIEVGGFGEWVCWHPTPSFTRTSYYTDNCDYILGFNLKPSIHTPELFPAAVSKEILKWKEMFGDEPYNIIHAVCVS